MVRLPFRREIAFEPYSSNPDVARMQEEEIYVSIN
jgi:hypothetical protein